MKKQTLKEHRFIYQDGRDKIVSSLETDFEQPGDDLEKIRNSRKSLSEDVSRNLVEEPSDKEKERADKRFNSLVRQTLTEIDESHVQYFIENKVDPEKIKKLVVSRPNVTEKGRILAAEYAGMDMDKVNDYIDRGKINDKMAILFEKLKNKEDLQLGAIRWIVENIDKIDYAKYLVNIDGYPGLDDKKRLILKIAKGEKIGKPETDQNKVEKRYKLLKDKITNGEEISVNALEWLIANKDNIDKEKFFALSTTKNDLDSYAIELASK